MIMLYSKVRLEEIESKIENNKKGSNIVKRKEEKETRGVEDCNKREMIEDEVKVKEEVMEEVVQFEEVATNVGEVVSTERIVECTQLEESVEVEEEEGVEVNSSVAKKKEVVDYGSLNEDQLWGYVKEFMVENGVRTAPVPAYLVEDRFGAKVIMKLVRKAYLVPKKSGYTMVRE